MRRIGKYLVVYETRKISFNGKRSCVFKSQTAQAVGWTDANRIIQAVTESHRAACAAALLKKKRVNGYKKREQLLLMVAL
jgi:hypothetical protein